MNERQAMNQEHPLNLRNPRVSALISGKKTHKAEIETIRELIEDVLHGRCNVLHQVGRLRGSAGIPDLYVQLPVARNHSDGWEAHLKAACCASSGALVQELRRVRDTGFWIEVKVGKDKLSPAQEQFTATEAVCGRKVIVGGVDEVIKHLRTLGYEIQG